MRFVFLILSLFIHLAFAHETKTHPGERYMVSFKLTKELKEFLRSQEYDVAGVNYQTQEVQILLSQEELHAFESKKFKSSMTLPQLLMKGLDPEYLNHHEVEKLLLNFHQQYPDLTMLKQIGTSLLGKPIWALKISDQASSKELDEPVILFNSMHHAREVMTPEVGIDIIEYLLTRYNDDEKVTAWVDRNEIWVIPMFNVDGNERMWNQDSMWRKNARDDYGVDLNRNYPFGWNSCNGSSGNRFSQTYRGTAPASEPETQAMMKFVSEIKPVFNISYHSFSELVIYPYGCEPKQAQHQEVVKIGQEMGKVLNYKAGTAWELLYNADGGDIDWMYEENQVIPFVIEVNSSMQGFQPDYKRWRNPTVERNRKGWQYLLDRLEGSGIRGVMAESSTIEIRSSGKKIQDYRINPDSTFHLVLPSGDYELIFKPKTSGDRKIIKVAVKDTLVRLH